MDFVTVTHMGIIFALQSYRNIFFLVRTTEFLFPAVMTYECYFLWIFIWLDEVDGSGRWRAGREDSALSIFSIEALEC